MERSTAQGLASKAQPQSLCWRQRIWIECKKLGEKYFACFCQWLCSMAFFTPISRVFMRGGTIMPSFLRCKAAKKNKLWITCVPFVGESPPAHSPGGLWRIQTKYLSLRARLTPAGVFGSTLYVVVCQSALSGQATLGKQVSLDWQQVRLAWRLRCCPPRSA